MRRGILLVALAMLFGLFGASSALATHGVPDGDDCREGAEVYTEEEDGHRSAVCVSVDGTIIAYVGGSTGDKDGGACGAIIVADTTITGSSDWGSDDPEDTGLLEEIRGTTPRAHDNPHCE